MEIEEGLCVRPAVLRTPQPAASAQQQRPILTSTAGLHARDHTDPICPAAIQLELNATAAQIGGYARRP